MSTILFKLQLVILYMKTVHLTILPPTLLYTVNIVLSAETENFNYTPDLDQGKRVSAEVSTNGVQCYWKGRAYYRVGNSGWKEYLSETVLFNADGIRV